MNQIRDYVKLTCTNPKCGKTCEYDVTPEPFPTKGRTFSSPRSKPTNESPSQAGEGEIRLFYGPCVECWQDFCVKYNEKDIYKK